MCCVYRSVHMDLVGGGVKSNWGWGWRKVELQQLLFLHQVVFARSYAAMVGAQ